MSSVYQMFDRTSLVEALDQDCLVTGKSAVVIGAPKLGKSHLLDHLSSRPTNNQESLTCKLSIYSLRNSLREGEALSDHVFLRFLLRSLRAQIHDWIEKLNALKEEDDWLGAIRRAEQGVELLKQLPWDDKVEELLERQRDTINALRSKMAEVDKLGKAAERMSELLVRPEPIRVYEVSDIFFDLHDIPKRIILMIDEFDRMMKEPGFTDNLFSFLRGNEGKIIAIVSSPLRLMDPSLHPNLDRQDRTDLFNHFQPKILDPFTKDEACDYLGWFPADTLTADEKEYLQSLGGGSPHFLKLARENFLRYGRPSTPAAREEFEKRTLSLVFEDAFHYIWECCTPADRLALRQISEGVAPDLNTALALVRQGYVVSGPPGYGIFCPLFNEYVKQQPAASQPAGAQERQPQSNRRKSPPPVEVEVRALQRTFTTSLYYADPDHSGFMSFKLTNNTQETLRVQLSWRLVRYSEWSTAPFDVPPGTREEIVKVVLDDDEVKKLVQPVAAQIEYIAVLISGDKDQELLKQTQKVQLLPINNFLLARFDEEQEVLVDFTWTIAAWVDNTEPRLQRVIKKAMRINPLVGQKEGPENVEEQTRGRVEALYRALYEQGIAYHESRLVFHEDRNDLVQRVRLPGETLEYSTANCLDAAVLFASLLSYCDIDPALLLIPEHALVGWKRSGDPAMEWKFVDVAGIADISFEDACRLGQGRYEKVKNLCYKFAEDSVATLSSTEFAVLVDVHRVWRERGLLPLRTYERR